MTKKKTDDKTSKDLVETNENLPALPTESFEVDTGTDVDIPDDVFDAIDEKDFDGYEKLDAMLPFVSIRQKDLKEGKKVIARAGDLKINEGETPDVDGDVGLVLSIMMDRLSRTYWEKLGDPHPKCKSVDSITGTTFGSCDACELSKFKDDGGRPKCGQHYNLLAFDHINRSMYIFQTSTSGIKPYKILKKTVRGLNASKSGEVKKIPMFAVKVKVTSEYVAEPAEHYIPVFEILATNDLELLKLMKANRTEFEGLFGTRVKEVDIRDVEDLAGGNAVDTEHEVITDEMRSMAYKKRNIQITLDLLKDKMVDIPDGLAGDIQRIMEDAETSDIELDFIKTSLADLLDGRYEA